MSQNNLKNILTDEERAELMRILLEYSNAVQEAMLGVASGHVPAWNSGITRIRVARDLLNDAMTRVKVRLTASGKALTEEPRAAPNPKKSDPGLH